MASYRAQFEGMILPQGEDKLLVSSPPKGPFLVEIYNIRNRYPYKPPKYGAKMLPTGQRFNFSGKSFTDIKECMDNVAEKFQKITQDWYEV